MKSVYLLQHVYQYGKNNEYDEIKVLGIFDCEETVKKAIEYYKKMPGFRDFSEECFVFEKYDINRLEWISGFLEE